MKQLLFLSLLLAGQAFPAVASTKNRTSTEIDINKALSFTNVQAGVASVTQGDGHSFGVLLRYLPSYHWKDSWFFGASIDATLLRLNDHETFTAIGYMGYAKHQVYGPWDLQMSAGWQSWTCSNCSTRFVFGPTVYYNVELKNAPWFKNVWAAYLPTFQTPVASTLQLGVGMQF